MDLARAHTLALEHLISKKQLKDVDIFNLGIGEGVTVLEMIEAFEQASNVKLDYQLDKKRPGDVPAIYSNFNKIKEVLGWTPQYSVSDIVETAWRWEKNRNKS